MWQKIVLFFIFLTRYANPEKIISSPRLTDWGKWGSWEYCPPGTFATGMQLYTQPHQGVFRDDKSLTGIRLFCNPIGVTKTNVHIQSSTDSVGKWGRNYFCSGVVTGFQLRSEPYRSAFVDDTSANNLRIFCDESSSSYKEGDGLSFGRWTDKQNCAKHEAVCGIVTQIDKSNSWDQTGLNNIKMKCCDLPHPLKNCIPKTSWVFISSCNSNPKESKKVCKYARKVGISYIDGRPIISSLYASAGYGLTILGPQLKQKFMNSTNMIYGTKDLIKDDLNSWKYVPSLVWNPQTSKSADITLKNGEQSSLYQLYGTCGMLQVWGTRFKQVSHTKLNGYETSSTTFFDFNQSVSK